MHDVGRGLSMEHSQRTNVIKNSGREIHKERTNGVRKRGGNE